MNQRLALPPARELLERVARDFHYSAGGIVYRLAGKEDNELLQSILKDNHMDSWVHMTLEREPNYFSADGLFGHGIAILAELKDQRHQAVGMGSYSLLCVHVNAEQVLLGYMGQLRVQQENRNHIRVLKSSYQALNLLTREIDPRYSFTSIASGNRPALRLLNANLKGMPVYTPRGQYVTLAISTALPMRRAEAIELVPACTADIPELVSFYNDRARQWQFSPVLSEQWMLSLDGGNGLSIDDFHLARRNGEIICCVAVWDQRSMKQTVARGYRFPINLLRRPYNFFARVSGRVELPKIGRQLEQAYLAFAAFGDLSDREVIDVVYRGLGLARAKGAKALVIGLSKRNPHAALLAGHFRTVAYLSNIETVNWPESPRPHLDARLVQPEAALL